MKNSNIRYTTVTISTDQLSGETKYIIQSENDSNINIDLATYSTLLYIAMQQIMDNYNIPQKAALVSLFEKAGYTHFADCISRNAVTFVPGCEDLPREHTDNAAEDDTAEDDNAEVELTIPLNKVINYDAFDNMTILLSKDILKALCN